MTNFLIDFVDEATPEQISEYMTVTGCSQLHAYTKMNKVFLVSSELAPPYTDLVVSVTNDDDSALQLLETIMVPLTTPSRTDSIDISDEKNWWKVYSMSDVDFSLPSTNLDVLGKNTNVYLVDSGIDITHSEFVGQDITLLHSLTGEFSDTRGHGTALASLVIGNTCGATAASLKVVKILDATQPSKQSDLLHAFDAILSDIESNITKFSVVNLSWSIPKNVYIEDKIRHLINAGAVVVAAAGNSGVPIQDVTPASMPEVLTIGSYNVNFCPSNFSDYTSPNVTSLTQSPVNEGALDSWAPGEQIWVAKVGGGFGFSAGTSVATAIYTASIVYDAQRRLNQSLDLPLYYRFDSGIVDTAKIASSDRTGLLDLSDPKYTASRNQICTFRNEMSLRPPKSRAIKIMSKVNQKTAAQLFGRTNIESYEWLSPLPIGAFDELGMLVLYPTTPPTSPSLVDVFDVECKLNLRNDTSASVMLYITIVIVDSTFDPALLPPDDPLINVTLLTVCNALIPVNPSDCYAGTGCLGGYQCEASSASKQCKCYVAT